MGHKESWRRQKQQSIPNWDNCWAAKWEAKVDGKVIATGPTYEDVQAQCLGVIAVELVITEVRG